MNCLIRALTLAATIAVVSISRAACRQMCLSCQYVDNPKKDGIECASAPRNWTFGDTRMRCNFRCMIQAHFDLKTGDPTYFYRGCTASHEVTEEGCTNDEAKEYCSFFCDDVDYCNSRRMRTAPSKDDSGAERVTSTLWIQMTCVALVLMYGTS